MSRRMFRSVSELLAMGAGGGILAEFDIARLTNHHFLRHGNESAPIIFPGMPLRLFARRNFHRSQTFAIARQQSQFFSDRLSRTNGNNKSIYAIINYVRTGGMQGRNNQGTLRHRFRNSKAESLEKRWKN